MAKKKAEKEKRMVQVGLIGDVRNKLCQALEKLYNATFDDMTIIDAIVTLQEELNPIVSGFRTRRQKLSDAIFPDTKGKGTFKYNPSSKEGVKYTKEYDKLCDEEIELKAKKILIDRIKYNESDLRLNSNDIIALRDHKIFEIRKSK